MARTPEDLDPRPDEDGDRVPPPRLGFTLIKLRNALIRARQCRRLLEQLDFAEERWMEIVTEVDPELRFVVRPQILDAIVEHLEAAGKPMKHGNLVRDLARQKIGTAERIRQAITMGLRGGTLALFPGKCVGLSEWVSP